jgi:uncharacterized repeat protein (TIGR03803 family)
MRRVYLVSLILCLAIFGVRPAQSFETTLHDFTGGSDGSPAGPLASDGTGNVYGTTEAGGLGSGTVYELSSNGMGGWNETVLYNFCSAPNCADGADPGSYVIFDGTGNLYGTASQGGEYGYGVVFEIGPATRWEETVLYSFANATETVGNLIMDSVGNFYGTNSMAAVKLSPSGGWNEQVIYQGDVYGALAIDALGNIFGIGSSDSYWIVFELSPNGHGGWNSTVIHTFSDPKKGDSPNSPLVSAGIGQLYGTTQSGGAYNSGTVYALIQGKKGKWSEKLRHSFKNNGNDGETPEAGVVLDSVGNIYGTTTEGGKRPYGHHGTVFLVGGGTRSDALLWNFYGPPKDGQYPTTNLILDSKGTLYGTTNTGGSSGYGVVFAVTP